MGHLIIFSYCLVQGLNIDDFAQEKMKITEKELIEERDAALETCQDWLADANLWNCICPN